MDEHGQDTKINCWLKKKPPGRKQQSTSSLLFFPNTFYGPHAMIADVNAACRINCFVLLLTSPLALFHVVSRFDDVVSDRSHVK